MARELLSSDALASRTLTELDPPARVARAVPPIAAVPSPVESASNTAKAEARAQGRLEAEAFDLRLRELEQSERASLLERLAVVGLPNSDGDTADTYRPTDAVRLQRDLDRLAEFHRLLVTSRSWRILQLLRRPFGRAW